MLCRALTPPILIETVILWVVSASLRQPRLGQITLDQAFKEDMALTLREAWCKIITPLKPLQILEACSMLGNSSIISFIKRRLYQGQTLKLSNNMQITLINILMEVLHQISQGWHQIQLLRKYWHSFLIIVEKIIISRVRHLRIHRIIASIW